MATRQKTINIFSHDSNARNDEKILRLRMKHGAAGYGVYFMLLERLRDEADYMSAKDYNTIAFDLRVSSALVKSVVEDFGLFAFSDDGKRFYSESFTCRMNIKDTKRQKRSEIGKAAMKSRWEKEKPTSEVAEPDLPFPETPQMDSPKSDSGDTKKYLARFFRKENQASIEVLLMNFGLQPNELPKLRKLAKEVVAEWDMSDKLHLNYTDWSQHLIVSMRRKLNAERANSNEPEHPPLPADYSYSGGFGGKDT